ncbi:MAG TPA: efflux RND transporter periplasmic adaptor subunit, partial [Vicinamibacterales bacterium]|nr:efflux RND transporter periplasmic adaptor subunit [Vicinamibacterales bacterium]
QRRFLVSAPVTGLVRRIDARPGDAVHAGRTVLAVIEPSRAVLLDDRSLAAATARLRTAEALVRRAQADRDEVASALAQATVDAQRVHALFKTGYASQQESEVADLRRSTLSERLRSADFAVRAAEFEKAAAAAALEPRGGVGDKAVTITAPIDGVVLRRMRESEASVLAGTPLIEIGDLRDLEIVADLISADAVTIRPGAAVRISRWGGDRDLAGRVRLVEPSGFMKISALGVEEQRVNVIIDFVDGPAARQALGDGFRVEVHIDVADVSGALKAPSSAVFRREGRWFVFVTEAGRARLRAVEVGARNAQEVEIRAGLRAGEQVVIFPGESLTDGQRVTATVPTAAR